jgi:hypothetical protein
MVACFGLHDGYQLARVPADRIAESVPRLDIFWLNRIGALVQGTVTELEWDTVGGPPATREVNLRREAPNLWINETRIAVVWDEPMPGVGRPWFLCSCGKRARFLYLRASIACARCHRLQNASRHLRRQMPALGRVERLRRKLGGCEERPFAPLPARIGRGRSRAYHDALVAAILDQEQALLGHLQTVTRDLSRRIEVRKRRGQW